MITLDEESKEKPEPKEEKPEEKPKEKPEETEETEEEIDEEEEGLPFPMAPVVRVMRANMDDEKMIKRKVKVAMNKFLGQVCAKVSREMNKFPYVMMHMNEFKEGTKIYRKMEEYEKEKDRILSHLDAIKKDIEKLERDLGKVEEDMLEI